MAAATAPSGRSLLGKIAVSAATRAVAGVAGRIAASHPALANLASVPLHVAGLACLDIAAFTGNTIAGWVITGLSLIWLEHVIADEQ